ncbi:MULTISPECIES: hypothetical protein [Ramlibacter]|uniref:Uncharacterized protein n=1 Tax=Ramlibacter pinisoli TaxID=2682844 RepID=A0A6N8ISU8_9BURK|nr:MULTISPECIES: hypothetical protein [Ramlibacter]MBA2964943.1 hypothetical protein [Ramlibacter sp. CGMCC 1.13660]MVQ29908.1 hypothetical protein [Ramlibacter pinisoli]
MSATLAPPPDHAATGGAVGWLLALVAACVCALVLAFAPPAQELQAQDIDLDTMVLVAADDAGDDDVRSLSVEPPCDADASDHKALPGLTLPSILASHTLAPTAIAGRPQRSEPPPQRPPRALA